VHDRELPGSPDILFPRQRVAVFCDGDFWHGRDWPALRRKLQQRANPGYWIPKIKSNIDRDRRQDAQLKGLGWTVVRVWESSILEDVELVVDEISKVLGENRSKEGSSLA
jgi:DNA mismatch endonuclease (patch repair protein)